MGNQFSRFAFPVLVTAVDLFFGFVRGLWHPMWVLFLFIPVYYAFFPERKNAPADENTEL